MDLFCGLGNFSLPMAQLAKQVHGYELSEEMVGRAANNACINNLDNLSFYAIDLAAIEGDTWLKREEYDAVLLDPPRSGAAEVMPTLLRLKPKRILYISCHWATMLRDVKLLSSSYIMKKSITMDMFPQTYHLETMVLLELKEDGKAGVTDNYLSTFEANIERMMGEPQGVAQPEEQLKLFEV